MHLSEPKPSRPRSAVPNDLSPKPPPPSSEPDAPACSGWGRSHLERPNAAAASAFPASAAAAAFAGGLGARRPETKISRNSGRTVLGARHPGRSLLARTTITAHVSGGRRGLCRIQAPWLPPSLSFLLLPPPLSPLSLSLPPPLPLSLFLSLPPSLPPSPPLPASLLPSLPPSSSPSPCLPPSLPPSPPFPASLPPPLLASLSLPLSLSPCLPLSLSPPCLPCSPLPLSSYLTLSPAPSPSPLPVLMALEEITQCPTPAGVLMEFLYPT